MIFRFAVFSPQNYRKAWALVVAITLSTTYAHAQIEPLPPVAPSQLPPSLGYIHDSWPDPPSNDRLASYPSELVQPAIPEGQPSAGPEFPQPPVCACPPRGMPRGARPGCFQQFLMSETYLPRTDDGLGINDQLVQATFAFPFFTVDAPLLVTPAFELQLLDGPQTPDVPPQLYDVSVQFFHIRRISDRWTLHIAATPGVHSDFEQSNSDAIRVPARLLGLWDWRPDTQLIIGVLFLDRDDINFLPVAGAIWTPNDDTRLELTFPRPRYARRFAVSGDVEWWWYISGELGGGSYAVKRTSGAEDVLTLSDLRAILGIERRVLFGLCGRVEVGYVFNRSVEYASSNSVVEPADTLMLRGGLSY